MNLERKDKPLTPALSPSEGERENRRPIVKLVEVLEFKTRRSWIRRILSLTLSSILLRQKHYGGQEGGAGTGLETVFA